MKKKEINNMSTVYKVEMGIPPSVEDIPSSARVAAKLALNTIYGVEGLAEIMKSLNERTPLGKMNRQKSEMLDKIKNVIFNNPATIVFWTDGTKTVVKCEHEEFDPEKGLAMAIVKKVMADNHSYYNEIFKKWLPKEEVCEDVNKVALYTYPTPIPVSKRAHLPKGRKNI